MIEIDTRAELNKLKKPKQDLGNCAYCGKKNLSNYTWALPFHSQTCAVKFAQAAYRGGYRMVRK